MKILSLGLALGSLIAFSSLSLVSTQPHTGDPGSIYASISVPSVSNIVGLMATILPSYLVNNQTIPVEFEQKGIGYNIKIHNVHVNSLNINERWIDFVPG